MKVGAFCFGDITRVPLLQDAPSAIARRKLRRQERIGIACCFGEMDRIRTRGQTIRINHTNGLTEGGSLSEAPGDVKRLKGRFVNLRSAAVDSEKEKLEHQIELATPAASYVKDETTVQRLLRFADELKTKLLRSSQHRKITARAEELWQQAGRPSGRDLDLWLEAEKQVNDENRRT